MIPSDWIFNINLLWLPFENRDTQHQLDNSDPNSSRQTQEIPTSWLNTTFFNKAMLHFAN